MRRRISMNLIALLIVLIALLGVRYQWARAHRSPAVAVNAQQDSLHRDSTTVAEPADTMCFAHRLGFPCDQ